MSAFADRWIPKLVLAPSVAIAVVFIYGFILITGYLSLTNSRLLPNYEFDGFGRYSDLFQNDVVDLRREPRLVRDSVHRDLRRARAVPRDPARPADPQRSALRAVFLYPMALSFIVTGTAWQWILNPGLGLEKVMHDWGWTSFSFGWLDDPDKAIFCVVIAAVWQSTGFVMALFLAGLRGVDAEIFKAAQVDGATLPTIYRKIVIPSMRPVFFSVLLILCHITIKTFDLVVALTAGGPGTSSSLPAMFMYTFSFNRGQLSSARRPR